MLGGCWVLCLCLGLALCAQDSQTNGANQVDTSTQSAPSSTTPTTTTTTKRSAELVCPAKPMRSPFFWPACRSSKDCSFLGRNLLCCKSRCVKGVPLPTPEPSHAPLFGVIDRTCPINPMPELLPVQECTADSDCGTRICCPEQANQGEVSKSYCRNAASQFTRMPAIRQALQPLKMFASYLQCSAPPPAFLDLFPKLCETPLDCFPSLCCQERGKKVCRPPMKSLFAFIAGSATRLGVSALAKSFIQRISK